MTGTIASTKVQVFAAIVALLLISGLVLRASSAAFTATHSNAGNAFETGTLALDDGTASALFNVQNMVPGQIEERCVVVAYSGLANPSGVKLYSGGYTDSAALDDWLRIKVEEGAGAAADCSDFVSASEIRSEVTLAAFDTGHTAYGDGVGAWVPASASESKTYRFTVTLDASTPDSQEGASLTGFGLTWEVQAGS